MVDPELESMYRGQKSVIFPGAMTIPPACFPTFLAIPSNLKEISMISETSSSF